MIDACTPFPQTNIHPAIKQGLIDTAHFRCTHIQEMALSHIQDNNPLILLSPSGTGKTCAFSILMLENICKKYFTEQWERPPPLIKGGILGLVLAHSPELCQQIAKEIQSISRHLPLSVFAIISSINLQEEYDEINYAHIVVATPGIIVKLLNKKKLKLFFLLSLVIDEWDKMLFDDGLNSDITKILVRPMPVIQNNFICSSATYNHDAYSKLIKLLPFQWELIRSVIIDQNVISQNIDERLMTVDPNKTNDDDDNSIPEIPKKAIRDSYHFICRAGSFEKRVNTIIEFFRNINFYQALIFCNIHQLSRGAEEALSDAGFPSSFISSQMNQRERLDRIAEFRDLQLRCLITTDIAARGFDVKNVNVVVSLDFPYDDETFLHRVGRAGRFMTNQISLTFYKRSESKRLTQIHQNCNIEFKIYDKKHPPDFKLLPLENEMQIQNFENLNEIEIETKKAEEKAEKEAEESGNTVPMMFYCEKENDYWDIYTDMCQKYKPPFAP